MKDYLNTEERTQMLLIGGLIRAFENSKALNNPLSPDMPNIVGLADAWESRNNITKDEARSIRMALTYFNKFFKSVSCRMNDKEKSTIKKKLSSYEFRIVDDYVVEKIAIASNRNFQDVHINRQVFFMLMEQVAETNCKGCKKDGKNCILHDELDSNFVPESGWDLPNCRYAYDNIGIEESNLYRRKRGLPELPYDWDKTKINKTELKTKVKK